MEAFFLGATPHSPTPTPAAFRTLWTSSQPSSIRGAHTHTMPRSASWTGHWASIVGLMFAVGSSTSVMDSVSHCGSGRVSEPAH